MFAFIFAVIRLSSINPDPIVTPSPALHDRLPGMTGFASGTTDTTNLGSGSVSVCTFGGTGFGSDAWANANAFARTLDLPACTAPPGLSAFAYPAYTFATFPAFAPQRRATPWSTQPALGVRAPGVSAAYGPARLFPLHEPAIAHARPEAAFVERARVVPVSRSRTPGGR